MKDSLANPKEAFGDLTEAPATEQRSDMITEEAERSLYKGYTKEEWYAPVLDNYEDSPIRAEVEDWKEKHGQIYFTPFDGEVYIWRNLKRPEYREIIRQAELTALDREEIITERCILYPRNITREKLQEGKAGVPSLLNEYILEKSGFVANTRPIKL